MTRFSRAAVVLLAVGAAFLVLAAVAGTDAVRAGAAPVDLVPIVLGIGLKGVLALLAAGVMAWAARLEQVRRRLQAARAVQAAAPARTVADPVEPAQAEPPLREAA